MRPSVRRTETKRLMKNRTLRRNDGRIKFNYKVLNSNFEFQHQVNIIFDSTKELFNLIQFWLKMFEPPEVGENGYYDFDELSVP